MVTLPDMEQLVDLHQATLYRFALGLTGSVHHAADLTQQTFLLWATKGHQLRDRTKVRSWLFTTLHREFLRMRRHEARHPHTDLDTAEMEMAAEEPEAWSRLDGRTVVEALHSVEEPFRAPLLLFYLEELSYSEIAEALEVPIGTIMSRISRGKTLLRHRLRDAMSERDSDPKILELPLNHAQRRQDPMA
jgi:RNA polymerase sigma-70 factor (ECF subfamily)